MSQMWMVENCPSKSDEATRFLREMSMQLIWSVYLVLVVQVEVLQVQALVEHHHHLLHEVEELLLFADLALLVHHEEEVVHAPRPLAPLVRHADHGLELEAQELSLHLLELQNRQE